MTLLLDQYEYGTEGPAIAEFLARFCRHPRGSERGQPVLLVPEQQQVLNDLFAYGENGLWKNREGLILVHRKWAKTLMSSGAALYALLSRGLGVEVYFAANSRQQAGILKRNVDAFAVSTTALRKRLYVYKNKIETPEGGYMMPLGADAHQAHGFNPYLSFIDEYWGFRDNSLPEALTSGSAARDESMTIYITTPGIDLGSPLGMLVERSKRGTDDSLHVHWPGRDITDTLDIEDKEAWEHYNIGYRHGWVQEAFLRSQIESLPRDEFVRLHLGGWMSRSAGWLDVPKWDDRAVVGEPEDGARMVLFIDGAWKHDSMALIGVVPGPMPKIHALKIWERPVNDVMWRVPYGELDDYVQAAVLKYKVEQIGCDPFFLSQKIQEWSEQGLPVVEIPTNSVPRAVSATKRFEDALMDGRLEHDGDPVMRRHLMNCVPKRDRFGVRVTRDRGNPSGFIDAGVGAIFGYDMASKVEQEHSLWIY